MSADGSIPRLERIQVIVVVPLEILKDLELSHLLLPCKEFSCNKNFELAVMLLLDYGHNKPQVVALRQLVQDSTTKHAAVTFVIFVSCIIFVIQKMRKVHRRLGLSGPDRANHAVLQCGHETYATFSPAIKG